MAMIDIKGVKEKKTYLEYSEKQNKMVEYTAVITFPSEPIPYDEAIDIMVTNDYQVDVKDKEK